MLLYVMLSKCEYSYMATQTACKRFPWELFCCVRTCYCWKRMSLFYVMELVQVARKR